MKKILSLIGTAVLLTASAVLISCGDSGDEYSGATDTVLTISAPSVKAKAYPGVNYISWEPVALAASYELYRTADGVDGDQKVSLASTIATSYADVASTSNTLADGKSYKYTVVAIAANDTGSGVPSRAVYVKSNSGSATVTAIVPAAGTAIDEFADSYTKNFLKKFDDANLAKNVVVTTSQLTQASNSNWGNYWISYPATAGYQFAVKTVVPSALGTGLSAGDTLANSDNGDTFYGKYLENYTENVGKLTLGSGAKDLYLTIKSVSDFYQPIVKKIGSVEFKSIGESEGTKNVTAAYTSATTAEIYWTPAKLSATADYTATTNYVVYRTSSADGDATYTKVSGTITAKKTVADASDSDKGGAVSVSDAEGNSVSSDSSNDKAVSTVYTITDTISDNTATYKYYVVHTDGTLYGAAADYGTDSDGKALTAATLYAWANKTDKPSIASAGVIEQSATSGERVIQILAKKANAKQTLALSYVKLGKDAKEADIDRFADFTESATLSNYAGDNLTYVAYITGDYDYTYVFKLTAKEDGKEDVSVYTTETIGSLSTTAPATAQIVSDADDATGLKYAVLVVDSDLNDKVANGLDSYDKYTYTLYSVTTVAPDKNFSDYITVTEEKIGEITFGALSATNKNKYGLTDYTSKDEVDSDDSATATILSLNAVNAPKHADTTASPAEKVTKYTSVRYYVTKQIKGNDDTLVQKSVTDDTRAFIGVGQK